MAFSIEGAIWLSLLASLPNLLDGWLCSAFALVIGHYLLLLSGCCSFVIVDAHFDIPPSPFSLVSHESEGRTYMIELAGFSFLRKTRDTAAGWGDGRIAVAVVVCCCRCALAVGSRSLLIFLRILDLA